MAKKRFIQMREPPYDFVEVTDDYVSGPRSNTDGTLWNDRHYDGLRATDGTPIDSRTKHREYMKINGLTTMDDFKGTWDKAAKDRADYYQGKRGSVSRQDVARAIAHLEQKGRR